jgi:hypothetical protein
MESIVGHGDVVAWSTMIVHLYSIFLVQYINVSNIGDIYILYIYCIFIMSLCSQCTSGEQTPPSDPPVAPHVPTPVRYGPTNQTRTAQIMRCSRSKSLTLFIGIGFHPPLILAATNPQPSACSHRYSFNADRVPPWLLASTADRVSSLPLGIRHQLDGTHGDGGRFRGL